MIFKEKLKNIVHKNNSLLCVGLDIDKEKMPKFLFEGDKDPFFVFNKSIIDATKDVVCAYKLNMAFYEALGKEGFELLEKTVNHVPKDVFVILDGKRNDIGNTAKKYAKSIFQNLNADSTTINPYLGEDGIIPFLEYKNKCSFILCRTSNPSAGDLQDIKSNGAPLYQLVAKKIKEWNTNKNCGAVVGATYPDELKTLRKILGNNIPILIPGIGAQGGDLKLSVKYGTNKDGKMAIINSSRGIIYSKDPRTVAISLRDEINKYR